MDPNIRVSATCVRIPVFISHAESINIEFDSGININGVIKNKIFLIFYVSFILHSLSSRSLAPPLSWHVWLFLIMSKISWLPMKLTSKNPADHRFYLIIRIDRWKFQPKWSLRYFRLIESDHLNLVLPLSRKEPKRRSNLTYQTSRFFSWISMILNQESFFCDPKWWKSSRNLEI